MKVLPKSGSTHNAVASSAEAVAEHEARFQARKNKVVNALEKAQAPAGSRRAKKLGLPPLLESRRLSHAMPDECFAHQAMFDRILLWQIASIENERVGKDSLIIAPETTQKREKEGNPRGVIVSAGLGAMDVIRSNGMDLGHIVGFVYLAPFKRPVVNIEGHWFSLIVLSVGDILDSEDTRAAIASGRIETRYDQGTGKHYYYDTKTKTQYDPRSPWVSDQY